MTATQKLQLELNEARAKYEALQDGLVEIRGYLTSPKFHEDSTVQAADIDRRIVAAMDRAEEVEGRFSYQQQIFNLLQLERKEGLISPADAKISPRWIEAAMRANHGTLDGISAPQFRQAMKEALWEVKDLGPLMAERVAASYGL